MEEPLLEVPLHIAFSKNVDAFPTLRKAVFGTVNDPPLHRIAKRSEAGENDSKISPSLFRWTLEKSVNVLEQAPVRIIRRFGKLDSQKAVDGPPEDALLAFNAIGMRERTSN
jgi:hypothetical protein